MKKLHENPYGKEKLVSEEGQRGFLCSNNKPVRCSSSDITNFTDSENDQIERLAEILVEAFLERKTNAKTGKTKSS